MKLDARQVAALALGAGLPTDAAVIAVAVAQAESGFRTDARGDVHLQTAKWGPSVGLWQIRSLKAESGTGGDRDALALTDPQRNAQSMARISSGGTNWQPWSVYNSGKYRAHLADARAAVATLEPGASFTGRAGTVARAFGTVAGHAVDRAADATPGVSEARSLARLLAFVSDPANWLRIAMGGAGVAAIGAGVLLIVKDTTGLDPQQLVALASTAHPAGRAAALAQAVK